MGRPRLAAGAARPRVIARGGFHSGGAQGQPPPCMCGTAEATPPLHADHLGEPPCMWSTPGPPFPCGALPGSLPCMWSTSRTPPCMCSTFGILSCMCSTPGPPSHACGALGPFHARGVRLGPPPMHVEYSWAASPACARGPGRGDRRAARAPAAPPPQAWGAVGPHVAGGGPSGPPPAAGASSGPPPPGWGGGGGGGRRRADCRPALLPVVPRPDAAAFHLHRELRDRL